MASTTEVPVASDRPPPRGPISYVEFLAWADEDAHAEWVDGGVIVMSPANPDHQDVLGFLHRVLGDFVEAHEIGKVYLPVMVRLTRASPPVDVQADGDDEGDARQPAQRSGREPDLVFVATEHADRIQATDLSGPPDLAVEIVSPDSVVRDRGDKFAEYEAARIPEYWLIDPLRREAAFYQLGPDGHYQRAAIDSEGVYHSAVLPGFWLKVDWLWQRPLPKVAEIRRLLGI